MIENLLAVDDRPRFFATAASTVDAPVDRHGLSIRAAVRSLAGMQKEALVRNSATGKTWRLVSDEGPYLDGFDEAPCPLSFLTTGMVSMFANSISDAAAKNGSSTTGMVLTLDNRYTMEGSARAGTMTGGALAPTLDVHVDLPSAVITQAFDSVPLAPLVREIHNSRFSLMVNGEPTPTGRVFGLAGTDVADPGSSFDDVAPIDGDYSEVIVKQVPAEHIAGVAGGVNTSLAENQSRTLHVRGVCTIREDGVKEIVQNLFQPIGSQFRFLSQEASEDGTAAMAPDAATYVAAGIGFCFMTQLGRYARIVRRDLSGYRIVQDLFLGDGMVVDPVETHVFLDTKDGPDFGRTALDMSEQTCFLHGLCRTNLDVELMESSG